MPAKLYIIAVEDTSEKVAHDEIGALGLNRRHARRLNHLHDQIALVAEYSA